jgi:murein lipoprotein
MKKPIALAALLAAGTLTGCATTSELAEVRAMAEKAQATADAAQTTANGAKATADQAMATANAASAKADSAEATANQVNEKVDRMFKKSMMK